MSCLVSYQGVFSLRCTTLQSVLRMRGTSSEIKAVVFKGRFTEHTSRLPLQSALGVQTPFLPAAASLPLFRAGLGASESHVL